MKKALATCFALALTVGLWSSTAHADYTVITPEQATALGGATGGNEIRLIDNGDGSFDIAHLFTTVGASAVPLVIDSSHNIVEGSLSFLVVGGGGAGSGNCGGGGGAGGLIYHSALSAILGTHAVTVGAGGAKNATADNVGENGSSTCFTYGRSTYEALGGGRSGQWSSGSGGGTAGQPGGSGGGAGGQGAVGAANQPDSTSGGYGNPGGRGVSNNVGGGGGGAGEPGGDATSAAAGKGGDGLEYAISGETRYYAGGGGGARSETMAGAAGGLGGGGAGAINKSTDAEDGEANTGSGGGGGCGGGGTASHGGSGGSGVVIVRYTVNASTVVATGAVKTVVNGEEVYMFSDYLTPGRFKLNGTVEARILVIGGGGAGASPASTGSTRGGAGGGGAGGFVEVLTKRLDAGVYDIVVGAGGDAGSKTTAMEGADGQPSKIMLGATEIVAAAGGGGGGLGLQTEACPGPGHDGGSGGGGSAYSSSVSKAGGQPVTGQGFPGGTGLHTASGAGGGGAGDKGLDTTASNTGADGGAGVVCNITGEDVVYAAGGGGGARAHGTTAVTGGRGGSGIGGNGGGGTKDVKTAVTGGKDGTGSGGGGGAYGQAGGAGGSGVVIIRIKKVMPEKPVAAQTTWAYDGLVHEPVPAPAGCNYVVTGDATAMDVGNYTVRVNPAEGYVWSDGTTDEVVIEWSITKPTLVLPDTDALTVRGWQEKWPPSDPVLRVFTIEGAAVTLPEANVTYRVKKTGEEWIAVGTLSDWRKQAVTWTAGDYEIEATIMGTASYDPPTGTPHGTFEIWPGRDAGVPGLAYSCDLTITGYTGEPIPEGAPLLVEIGEDLPVGFTYRHALPDGSDIRFTDQDGNILAMSRKMWNPSGCSIFVVQVPDFKEGQTIRMNWGRTVDADGNDIAIPEAPALPQEEPLHHFAFNGAKTDTGTAAVTMHEDDNTVARYVETGFAPGDQAMTGWTGYSNEELQQPETFSVALYARISATEQTAPSGGPGYSILWGIGHITNGGYAIITRRDGTVKLITWTDQSAWTTVAETTIKNAAEEYHQYRVNVSGTDAAFYVDGVYVGSGTITRPTESRFQFGGTYWGRHADCFKTTDSYIADFTVYAPHSVGFTVGPVYTVENARLKNYWHREPEIGKRAWGTGQEPTPDYGLAAYGEAYFEIAPLGGASLGKDAFPTSAGAYTVIFRVDAGGNSLVSWSKLETAPVTVEVTAHSPYSDLGTTASGRVLLANDYTNVNDGQSILSQAYDTITGEICWKHSTEAPYSRFPNLRTGYTHTLNVATPLDDLCGGTNLWTLSGVYIGSTKGNTLVVGEGRRPIYYPETEQNDTHLMMRNVLDAEIRSACLTNGIGTIYFDGVNGWQDPTGTNYAVRVEICKGVYTDPEEYDYVTWEPLTLYPLFHDSEGSVAFTALEPTTEFSFNATRARDEGSFYRVYAPVNVREPVTFRIVRTSAPTSGDFALDQGGFIILDNIIASAPATYATLAPTGAIDPDKHGKAVVGVEGAATTPYPAVDEPIYLKAVPTIVETVGAPKAPEIIAAKAHYRWRYLDQAFAPADGSWKEVNLLTSTFEAADPLELPAGRVGDVEFFYTVTADAPYYNYYDYSGLNLKFADLYSEEIAETTNRCDVGVFAATKGTDWFLRLREGTSPWGGLVATVTDSETNHLDTVVFDLIGDHTWRGYVPTRTAQKDGLRVQLALNGLGVTNVVKVAQDIRELPASVEVTTDGTTNDWTRVVCDAATGGLLFQLDDTTHALTIAHADYQDFNKWNDAHKATFVGTSTKDAEKVGVSSKMRDVEEEFTTWPDTPATNKEWIEGFTDGQGDFSNWKPFVAFNDHETPNGWTAGPGMFVNEQYKPDSGKYASGAYQMEGQGKGYLEYPGLTTDPRGIESISYRARLAQTIGFNDIGWRYIDNISAHTGYTFGAQVVLDNTMTAGNTRPAFNHDGAAQASLVANYRPMVGCYEFRITRLTDVRMGYELYKWTSERGVMKATLLKKDAKSFGNSDIFRIYRQGATTVPQYPIMYISAEKQADGSVKIQAGLSNSHADQGGTKNDCVSMCYWDGAPGKLATGTYGVASANCNAMFVQPRVWSQPMGWLGGTTKNVGEVKTDNVTWPTDDVRRWESEALAGGDWIFEDGRLIDFTDTDSRGQARWGIKADVVPQPIVVQYKLKNSGTWQTLTTNTVSGFTLSTAVTTPLYLAKDATFRIAHAATTDDVRVDVTLDDVQIRQWVGSDYDDKEYESVFTDSNERSYGCRPNIVFTSGWVTDHAVKMSAKRTRAKALNAGETTISPCTIRSPLFDGLSGRGQGLGMVSFRYENAQANARLLVQIATNNVAGTIRSLTRSIQEAQWTTVTNFDFSTMSAAERRQGTKNCYLGLHGVTGVMRVIVDPALVLAVENEKDPNRFGEIDITEILFRDEPTLDLSSWWGWNVNTVSDDAIAAWHDGSRMYLPDAERGFSLALNNSVTADIDRTVSALYPQHLPFVQTPTFSNNVVGEVSFKARMFANDAADQKAEVWLYGAQTGDTALPDEEWHLLKHFTVSNTWYETYHYRSKDATDTYKAFRLAVTGVPGATAVGEWAQTPQEGAAVRVMIDELFVSEAVYPTVGFKYVYPVRTYLDENLKSPAVDELTGLANPDEQPLLGENWTIQTEIVAKQLPDEIDFETPGREPRVFFHWFPAQRPWGYANWTTVGAAKPRTAELALAEGESMVFRGSFHKAPTAIVEESTEEQFAVCQYTASVVYWDKAGDCHTNFLNRAEWLKPTWYDPIDYNAKSSSFAAFTILETVSPGRAWINEVNIYDGKSDDGSFPANDNQYLEIAVPDSQSLAGWRVEYVNNSLNETNTLCRFGTGIGQVTPTKTDPMTNDYVFIAVASPATELAGTWVNVLRPDGKKVVIDGTWANFDNGGGLLEQRRPIGLRLVRPSGAVAQEIVMEGKNRYAGTMYEGTSSITNYLANIQKDGSHWYIVGDESDNDPVIGLEGRSLGVVANTGTTSNDWTKAMHQTPGWCNEGQIVPEGWAILPNGAMIVVTARLEGGNIVQTFGDATLTTDTIRVTTPKGGSGTNIVYTVDTWYELGGVTTNDQALAVLPAGVKDPATGKMTYVVTLGAGCSNNLSVVAKAAPWSDLATKYGIDPNGKYAPAIMDWLVKGVNFYGQKFKNPGEIALGEYWPYKGKAKAADLTLTDMYWLDMDPTEGNWRFVAGVSEAPQPVVDTAKTVFKTLRAKFANPDSGLVETDTNSVVQTKAENVRIALVMYMTNTVSHVNYAPYVLRGVAPGETSYDYYRAGEGQWGAASFKLTGDLQNGNPNRTKWVPLRWFYFVPNMAFDAETAGTRQDRSASFGFDDFKATIEIKDPYDVRNTGTTGGWDAYRDCTIFYGWAIDEKIMPITVEALKPDATFK